MRPLHFDAVNPHTGRGYTFDDPNLFFGPDGLGYTREPGDPGFVPYLIPADPSTPNHRRTQMKRQNYFPTRQADQTVWLENFRLKLALHAAALGLPAPRVADIVADARCWSICCWPGWNPCARMERPPRMPWSRP